MIAYVISGVVYFILCLYWVFILYLVGLKDLSRKECHSHGDECTEKFDDYNIDIFYCVLAVIYFTLYTAFFAAAIIFGYDLI